MELKHLRYFSAAVEEGSLQAAAARLNVAQPALSRRVRDLEAAIGCQLLIRGARGIEPTRAGLALYRDAVAILDSVNEAIQRARQQGHDRGRSIGLGLAPTVARKYAFLRQALEKFTLAYPAGSIAIRQGSSTELAEGLREGTLDLALMYEQRPDSPHVAEHLIHREAYVLAVHPAHRLAAPGPADLAELTGQPLIWLTRRDNAGNVNPMMAQLRRHGLEPVIGQLAETPEEQLDIVMASVGACITPASTMLAVPPGSLHFRALPKLDATIDFTLAWRRTGLGDAAMQLLAELEHAVTRHRAAIAEAREAWISLDGSPLYRL